MKKNLLLVFAIVLFSCSSDDSKNNCENLSTEGAAIIEELLNAAISFSVDPSPETCTEYRNTAQQYMDYSNSIKDCLEANDRAELEEEIQDLEAELAELDCT